MRALQKPAFSVDNRNLYANLHKVKARNVDDGGGAALKAKTLPRPALARQVENG
jgi:hypothetical protein